MTSSLLRFDVPLEEKPVLVSDADADAAADQGDR